MFGLPDALKIIILGCNSMGSISCHRMFVNIAMHPQSRVEPHLAQFDLNQLKITVDMNSCRLKNDTSVELKASIGVRFQPAKPQRILNVDLSVGKDVSRNR